MFGSFLQGNSEYLISTIILLITYIFSVTLAGVFQVAVADYYGDSTARDLGLLSFNPWNFISPFGILVLIVMRLGWGKFIPINPDNIEGSNKKLKTFFIYLAPALVHFVLSVIAIGVLVLGYSFSGLMINVYNLPESYSGIQIALLLLLQGFIFFNIFVAFLEAVIGLVEAIVAIGIQEDKSYAEYAQPILLITPFVTIMLLFYVFSTPIIYLVYWIAYLFSVGLGAL